MSELCTYIKTCPSRIAFGDAPNGCNKTDESTCSSASDFYRWYQEEHIERFHVEQDEKRRVA
jgi:hypothetical protein